jgi:outer membrane receptor protein involved in Fe transport
MFKTKYLISVGIMLGLVTAPLFSQNEVEEVVVTGTRITTDGFESVSPVEVITLEEINVTGQTRIEDVLNQFPQIETAGNSFTSTSSGVSTLDLRGLGASRTLILLNGRRMAPGSIYSEVPDVGQMPLSMLERVDVLTGGASAVYGSDAIAGAVNFITRQVEGVEISWQTGGYRSDQGKNAPQEALDPLNARGFDYPTGVVNDGDTNAYDIVMGVSSGDGRGNISMYARHVETDDVYARDRAYSACSLNVSSSGSVICGGSSTTPIPHLDFYPLIEVTSDTSGEYEAGDNYVEYFMNYWGYLNPDGTLTDYDGEYVYNYAAVATLLQGSTRDSMGAVGNYEVSARFKPYFEVNYSSYNNRAGIAESGTFYAEYYDVLWDNSNWTDALKQDVINHFVDGDANDDIADGAYFEFDAGTEPGDNVCIEDYDGDGATLCGNWIGTSTGIGKRNTEGGPRTGLMDVDAVRWVIGANGDIGVNDFIYDISYTYASTTSTEAWINDFSLPAITAAIEGDQGGYDVMTYGGVTKAQSQAMGIDGMMTGNNTLKNLIGYISGNTSFSLPSAQTPVGLVAGFENRVTEFSRLPDHVYANGLALGFSGAIPPLDGSIEVTEFFGEVNIPIIENVPAIQSLGMDLAYRSSDYNLVGKVTTDRIGLTWLPTDRVRVRAGINGSERAPTIEDLYYPANDSLWSGNDYCSGATPEYTEAQCALTGVSSAQYGRVTANPAGQYNSRIGGNPLLKNESADTTTLGVVVDVASNITASVDLWDIEINGAIESVSAETIIELCAVYGQESFCNLINRNANGSLWQGSAYVQLGAQNAGLLHYSGIDFAVNANFDVLGGTLNISSSATQMRDKTIRPIAAIAETEYDCVGIISDKCFPTPEWRTRSTASFSTGGNWAIGAAFRTMSGVTNTYAAEDVLAGPQMKDMRSWIDINASYRVLENVTVNFAVQNLTDEQPPVLPDVLSGGYANTVSGNYDMLGQYWTLSIDSVF